MSAQKGLTPKIWVSFHFVAKNCLDRTGYSTWLSVTKKYLGRWPIATFLISVIYTYCGCLTYAITVTNGRLFKATSFPFKRSTQFLIEMYQYPEPLSYAYS
jgi:hypothetical protein